MQKKPFTFFSVMLLLVQQAAAQNIFPASGNVGIGITSPTEKLQVRTVASGEVINLILLQNTGTGGAGTGVALNFDPNGNGTIRSASIRSVQPVTGNYADLRFYVAAGSVPFQAMKINTNGNVSVGSVSDNSTAYKLFVEKGILTEKVKVAVKTSTQWSDYVFDDQYILPPLNELEQFIKQHKHLPGIPSAAEMVKEGNDLLETDARLLAKIEEQSLYIISLHKQLEELQKEVQQMKTQLQNTPANNKN